MATPQWVLIQRRIKPAQKSFESQYEKNVRLRQKEAIKSAVRKGLLKHLDQQMIIESVGDPEVQELDQVTYISLPSSSIQSIDDLSILSSTKLSVINLPYNYITDISPLISCECLLKLDVSGNQITNIPGPKFWMSLQSLKVLYLNNNIISSKEAVLSLSHCCSLLVLTMHDNPMSLLPNYRHTAVNCILSLKALDHHIISDQEIIENLHVMGKFRSFAKPFHRVLYLPVDKEDSLSDELKKIQQLLLSVDLVLSHHSPVVIIQKWIRGWLTRNKLIKSNNIKLRYIVGCSGRHRVPSTKRLSRILRGATPFVVKRQEGRLGTCDLPLPPPCSPMPLPPSLSTSFLDKSTDYKRHPTKKVLKAIKETKHILSKNESKKSSKKSTSRKKPLQVPPLIANDQKDNVQLTVLGEHQTVSEIDKVKHIKDTKKKGASEIKEAECYIHETFEERKKELPIINKHEGIWAKDSYAFTRAHGTMTLSMLKDITKKQYSRRKEDEISKKAEIVARIKEERVIRKEKIYQNQMMMKDAIAKWRISEERRLQEKKEQTVLEQEIDRVKMAEDAEKMAEELQNRKEKEEKLVTFAQQHNMLSKLSHKEERRSLMKSFEDARKEKTQASRFSAQEQAEIVKRFMHLREEKLRSESNEEKERLNTQMIQLASQKLMEAKQKVAKVKAWKKIAKSLKASDNVAITTTNDLSNIFESIPEADAVDVGLLGPLLKAYAGVVATPNHMRRMTSESLRTWQRGSIVMQQLEDEDYNDHLPKLHPISDKQPLMYDQMRPLPYFHTMGTTPNNSYQTTPLRNTPVVLHIPDTASPLPNEQDQQDIQFIQHQQQQQQEKLYT